MERTRLAPDLEISRVVTGMWQVADMERDGPLDPDATAAAMAPYADAGLTTFDMADHYGSAEVIAGRFRAGRDDPSRVQLLTKWVPGPAAGPDDAREAARAAVERAAGRLGTDRVDLVQYHAWRYSDPRWIDHLEALEALRDEGRIGHLGLTNFDAAHLAMACHTGFPVVSNQVSFSLLDRRPLSGLTAVAAEHGVGILAFGTLAGGLLTERWLGAPAPAVERMDTWSRMKYRRYVRAAGGWERFQGLLREVAAVARRLGVSMANVATRWVLEQEAVAAVVVGARLGRSEHLADTLRTFDFELDEEAREALAAAADALDPLPGDSGDEYRTPPFLTASGDLSHHVDTFPPPYPVTTDERGVARAASGTSWEASAGYCRAVRIGSRIHVSGTTATHGDRLVGGDDAGAQAAFVLDKIEGAIQSLGGSLGDVVRTRIFVREIDDWEAVAREHGRRFGDVRPANTLVQAGLIGERYRVEIEAEAVAGDA